MKLQLHHLEQALKDFTEAKTKSVEKSSKEYTGQGLCIYLQKTFGVFAYNNEIIKKALGTRNIYNTFCSYPHPHNTKEVNDKLYDIRIEKIKEVIENFKK